MALASIDEAIRTAVCVGGDPEKLAILDNFGWPSVDDEVTMGTLVRACEACRDGALAYGVPFISGKDSLHNQFTNQETREVLRIPRTLLISAIGVIDDVRKCLTMDLKHPDSEVLLIGPKSGATLEQLRQIHRFIADQIKEEVVASCHDVSDGGAIVAAAEMCIASGIGIAVEPAEGLFDETTGSYLVEVRDAGRVAEISAECAQRGIACRRFGLTLSRPVFSLVESTQDISIDELTKAWRGTLDW
jgi:phosphoribosylformylglycinamidine synthase